MTSSPLDLPVLSVSSVVFRAGDFFLNAASKSSSSSLLLSQDSPLFEDDDDSASAPAISSSIFLSASKLVLTRFLRRIRTPSNGNGRNSGSLLLGIIAISIPQHPL